MLPTGHQLSSVNGVFNAIYITGDAVGEAMFFGEGAGAGAAASAVMGDVIEVARHIQLGCGPLVGCTCVDKLPIVPIEDLCCRYYIRFTVADRPGVMAAMAGVFAKHGVSLYSVSQRGSDASAELGKVSLSFVTHTAAEKSLRAALAEIAKLPHMVYVKDASNEIRRVREIQALSPLKVFNGGDDIAFEAFVLGAIGWISVAANVIPKQCQEIFDLVWADKIREAEKLYFEVLPIISHIEECGKPAQTVKAALNKMGLPGGYCRKPRIALLPEEDAALEAVMKKVGLIK